MNTSKCTAVLFYLPVVVLAIVEATIAVNDVF